jgi:DNA invertase Pin-like site-specific DNA recombinase
MEPRPYAVYARISNRYDEKTDSLNTQRDACLKFAGREGFPVNPDWVELERDSGYETADERVGLLRIRQLARDGRIGGVILHNTDRLSREPIELCSLVQELRRNDAEIHFVLAPMEDTPTGKAMLFLRGVGHEMEWLAIRERTTRIKDEIVASGRFVGEGGPRYGYRWDKATRSRVADPVSSEWVRLIFRLVGEEGLSMRQVAIELNRRNVPTPAVYKGKQWRDGRVPVWTSGGVRLVIVDEVYKGTATARRVRRVAKRKFERLPRSQWVELADGRVEAIVAEDLWESANRAIRCNDVIGQRTRKANAAGTRNEKQFAFFRGIIACGQCGSPLRVAKARRWNKETKGHGGAGFDLVYRCDSRRRDHERNTDGIRCYGQPVYEHKVRDAAWSAIVNVILDESLIEAEIDRIKSERPGETLFRESLNAALAEQKACDNKAKNLVVSMSEEDDPEIRRVIRDRVAALLKERDGHAVRAGQLTEKLAHYDQIEARAQDLKRRANQIRQGIDSQEMTWQEKRKCIDGMSARFTGNGLNIRMILDLGLESELPNPLFKPTAPSRKSSRNAQRPFAVFSVPIPA